MPLLMLKLMDGVMMCTTLTTVIDGTQRRTIPITLSGRDNQNQKRNMIEENLAFMFRPKVKTSLSIFII